jgi:hypothetical protein
MRRSLIAFSMAGLLSCTTPRFDHIDRVPKQVPNRDDLEWLIRSLVEANATCDVPARLKQRAQCSSCRGWCFGPVDVISVTPTGSTPIEVRVRQQTAPGNTFVFQLTLDERDRWIVDAVLLEDMGFDVAQPNSTQQLSRPDFGPAAELPRPA